MQIQRVDMLLNAKVGLKLWDFIFGEQKHETHVHFYVIYCPVQYDQYVHVVHVVQHDRFHKNIPSCHHVPSFMTYMHMYNIYVYIYIYIYTHMIIYTYIYI